MVQAYALVAAGVLEADGCTFANNRVESNYYGGAIFIE